MAQLVYKDVDTPSFTGLPSLLSVGQTILSNAGTAAENALKEYGRIQKDKVLKPWAVDTLTTMDPVKRMEVAKNYRDQLLTNPYITTDDINIQGTWGTEQYKNALLHEAELQDRALASALAKVTSAKTSEEVIANQDLYDASKLGAVNLDKLISKNREQGLGIVTGKLAESPSIFGKEKTYRSLSPLLSTMGSLAPNARVEYSQGLEDAKAVLLEQQRQEENAISATFEQLLLKDPSKAKEYLENVKTNTLNNTNIKNKLRTNYDAYITREVSKLNTARDALAKQKGVNPAELSKFDSEYLDLVNNAPSEVQEAYLAQPTVSSDWNKRDNITPTDIKTRSEYGRNLDAQLAQATKTSELSTNLSRLGLDIHVKDPEGMPQGNAANLGTDFSDMPPEDQQQVMDIMHNILPDPFKGFENTSWYSPLKEAIKGSKINDWVKNDASLASLITGYADQTGPNAGKDLVEFLASTPGITRSQFIQALYDKMGNPDQWVGMRPEDAKAVQLGRDLFKKQWLATGGSEESLKEAFINGRFNHKGLLDQASKDKQIIAQLTKDIEKAKNNGIYDVSVDLTNINNPEVLSKDSNSPYYNKPLEIVAADELLKSNITNANFMLNSAKKSLPQEDVSTTLNTLVSNLVGKTGASESEAEAIKVHTAKQINKLKSWGISEKVMLDALSKTPDTNNFIYSYLTGRAGQYDAEAAFKYLKKTYGITENMTPTEINQKINSVTNTGEYMSNKYSEYYNTALTLNSEAKTALARYRDAKKQGNIKLAIIWQNKYNSLMAESKILQQKIKQGI